MEKINEIIESLKSNVTEYAKELETITKDGSVINMQELPFISTFHIEDREIDVFWKYKSKYYNYGDQLVFEITDIWVDRNDTDYKTITTDNEISVEEDENGEYSAYVFDENAILSSLKSSLA